MKATKYDTVSAAYNLVNELGLQAPEAKTVTLLALDRAYAEGRASARGVLDAVLVAAPGLRHILRCYEQRALPAELDIALLRHVLSALGAAEGKPPTSSATQVTQPHMEKILAFAQEQFTVAFRYMIEHGTWIHSFVSARAGGEDLAMLLVHRPRKEVDALVDALVGTIEAGAALERVQGVLEAHGARNVEPTATFEQIGMPLADAVRYLEAELTTTTGGRVRLDFGGKTPTSVGDLVAAVIGPHEWKEL